MELDVKNDIQKIEILNPISYMMYNQVQPYQIQVKVNPDNANTVNYKSSNPEIISVDNTGKIKPGRKSGRAKITAYIGDVEDYFYINVVADYGFESTTGVKITNKKTYMKVGDTYDLEAETIPTNATNQDMTFSSSNEAIATIDSKGKITALQAGNATITVNSSGFSDSYNLTVVPNEVPITSFELSKHKVEMSLSSGASEPTETISVAILPNNTTQDQTFTCSSSDRDIASVTKEGNNIIIKGHKAGKATITVTSTENENLKDTCEVDIYGFSFKQIGGKINKGDILQTEYISHLKNPNENYEITYSSNRSDIASVDENGKILMKTGNPDDGWTTITLTATMEDGTIYTAKISVIGYTNVTGIDISPKVVELEVGDEGDYFRTSITPMGATDPYPQYFSSNSTVATVDRFYGKITALKEGRTTITAQIDGFSASCEVVVVSTLHSDKTVYETTESTCKTHGHGRYEVCNICGLVTGDATPLPLANHKGGTATCAKGKICEICGEEYGTVDTSNHSNIKVYEAEESTCKTHGHERYEKCNDCGTIISGNNAELPFTNKHKGGTATCSKKSICELCNQEYGDLNSTNHINTELRNTVSATTEQEGYSGDLYCKDCDTLLKKGELISKIQKNEEKEEIQLEEKEKEKPIIIEQEQNLENNEKPIIIEQEQNLKNNEKPNTGDNSHIELWISLSVISGILFVLILKWNTKKRKGKYAK